MALAAVCPATQPELRRQRRPRDTPWLKPSGVLESIWMGAWPPTSAKGEALVSRTWNQRKWGLSLADAGVGGWRWRRCCTSGRRSGLAKGQFRAVAV
eukprot:11609351-Alexandrium_andersonii.AAC.1